jgi:tetratricopeptide (TPR) repeat protein
MERLAEEWLMIFDDCNLSDRQGHLPGRGKGNIIYTSRQTSLNQDLPVECTYEVTPFGEEDAIELLSKASGSPETSENTQDRKTAEAIVRELECLPLAVEKAAAFIRDGGYSLQEYLKKLRDEKVRILSESRSEDEDETNIESPAVHAALELSYQAIASRRRLEGRSGAGLAANLALKVLSLLTFFHHKDFPSLIMKRAAEEHHSVGAPRYCPLSHLMSPYDYDLDRMVRVKGDGHWNPSDFTSGVTILRKFSLVKLSSDRKSLSMHVLVHRWARKRMDKDVVLRWALVARVLLVESLDLSARLGYLQASRDMRPHFEVCFAVEPPLDLIRDQYRAHLLHKLGRYYRDQKRFLDAEECYTQSLRLWRMDLDADCGAVIDVSRSLAQLYHEMGRLGDAELMYLEAIETLRGRLEDMEASTALEKRGGRESPPPAVSSKPYAKSVMRTLVGRLSEHSSGGILSSGLPRLRKRSSKSKEPERPCEPDMPNMLDDGMLVWTRGSGEHFNEVEVIDAASNVLHAELGTVYMDQDRYGVGKRMLLQAVGYLEKQLDKYDPDLMKLQIKARTLTDAGNREVWEHYLADVLQAPQELTLRFWHSEACFDLMIAATYSLLMRDPEDWGAACRELFRLYDAGIKWYGGYDRKMLKVFRYLVECLIVGGDYDSAAFMADICLRRARSTYGELHMESIRSYVTLASAILHQRIELDEKARRVWQEAIDKARAGLGSTHSLTRSLEGHLRKLAEKVERAEQPFPEDLDPEAALMESWRRSEALLEKDRASLGGQHPLIKQSEIFVGDGPVRTKEELLERARAAYGPHNPLTKRLEMELGETQRSASARGPEEDLEPGSSTASRSSVPESHNAERNGKGLRQPLDLINKMTKARHTALRSQEPKSKTRELMAADNFALDDRVLAMISELEGDDLGDPADAETGGDMDAIKLGCQGLFK